MEACHHKNLITMLGVKVGDHHFLKTNVHVFNENLYFVIVVKQCCNRFLMVQLLNGKKICSICSIFSFS
jgi:hypothetical protein